jgi:hypothetical protein
METVLLSLVALACPIGMGTMMWFMARGMRGENGTPPPLEALREEHRRLGDEIERLEDDRAALVTVVPADRQARLAHSLDLLANRRV